EHRQRRSRVSENKNHLTPFSQAGDPGEARTNSSSLRSLPRSSWTVDLLLVNGFAARWNCLSVCPRQAGVITITVTAQASRRNVTHCEEGLGDCSFSDLTQSEAVKANVATRQLNVADR